MKKLGIAVFLLMLIPLTVVILQQQHSPVSHAQQEQQLTADTGVMIGNLSIGTDPNTADGHYVLFGVGPTITIVPSVTSSPTSSVPTSTPTLLPTNTATVIPSPTPTQVVSAGDPVILAAGDIACGSGQIGPAGPPQSSNACWQFNTASLVKSLLAGNPNIKGVLELGDIQYPGTFYGDFAQYYGSVSQGWGDPTILNISHPVPGNHDYTGYTDSNPLNVQPPAAYLSFYGIHAAPNGKTYYSYNLGSWHLIALDSDCQDMASDEMPSSPANLVNCDQSPGSDELSWMKTDISQYGKTGTVQPHACILAYWHHPSYTSWFDLSIFNDKWMTPFWQELYKGHADLILNGHAHMYERFSPINPSSTSNSPPVDAANGIPEIISGTGGRNLDPFHSNPANEVVRNDDTMGVTELTLHAHSVDFKFVPDPQSGNGIFTDAGTYQCH